MCPSLLHQDSTVAKCNPDVCKSCHTITVICICSWKIAVQWKFVNAGDEDEVWDNLRDAQWYIQVLADTVCAGVAGTLKSPPQDCLDMQTWAWPLTWLMESAALRVLGPRDVGEQAFRRTRQSLVSPSPCSCSWLCFSFVPCRDSSLRLCIHHTNGVWLYLIVWVCVCVFACKKCLQMRGCLAYIGGSHAVGLNDHVLMSFRHAEGFTVSLFSISPLA